MMVEVFESFLFGSRQTCVWTRKTRKKYDAFVDSACVFCVRFMDVRMWVHKYTVVHVMTIERSAIVFVLPFVDIGDGVSFLISNVVVVVEAAVVAGKGDVCV